jgi:hypothetical protein
MKRVATGLLLMILSAVLRAGAQITHACEKRTEVLQSVDSIRESSVGTITGTLKDERGNPIVNAYVECTKGGVIQAREVTDFDGNYTFLSLQPGRLAITIKSGGRELTIFDIGLTAAAIRVVNGTLASPVYPSLPNPIRCGNFRPPLIDLKYPGGHTTYAGPLLW